MRNRPLSYLAAVSLAWMSLAQAQPQTDADLTLLPYAASSAPAQVAPGRTINLVCLGQGSPTVIFSAGLGNWSEIWRKVQPAVAKTTRTCAWDRAGFGLSSPSSEPQDVAHTTADLERALKISHIDGPYLVVGHSLGGYESLLFVDHHLSEIVGMVLVDPSFPDQTRVVAKASPLNAKTIDQMTRHAISDLQICAAKLKSGEARPGDAGLVNCLDHNERAYPAELSARFRALESDPARFTTQASTLEQAISMDSILAINPRRNYGDLPLIVLTAGQAPNFPPEAHIPPEVAAEWTEFLAQDWLRAHDDIASLSKRGRNQVVTDSAHYIQMVKPQVVIDAIDRILSDARH